MVNIEGIVTAALVVVSVTPSPALGAAALIVTVQVVVVAPVADGIPQLSPVKFDGTGTPVPVNLIGNAATVPELLFTVSCPLTAPKLVGSNLTVRVCTAPGLSVSGNVAPDTENPDPANVKELIVTGTSPEDVRVTDLVPGVFNTVLPKAKAFKLVLRLGIAAFKMTVKF